MEPITFDNYRDYDAINYSKLKTLSDHPRKIHEERDWSDGLEFGDALDLLVFTPDLFREEYYVGNMDNEPSDRVKNIMEDVVRNYGEEITDDHVIEAANREGYGESWNRNTRLNKILRTYGGARYARMLLDSRGKRVMSTERHMQITQAVETLKKHEWTKHLLFDDLPDHMQRFTQFPMLSFGKPLYKSLFDLLIVDHKKKKFYPWDLKNTGVPVHRFRSQFVSYQYYLQAALYSYVLGSVIAEAEEGAPVQEFIPLDFNPSGYKVDNFGFIVISSQDTVNPMRYKCTESDLYAGMSGGILSRGREVKGFIKLTEEYLWHKKNDLWSYPYEVYKGNGEVDIDVFKSPMEKMSKELGGIF